LNERSYCRRLCVGVATMFAVEIIYMQGTRSVAGLPSGFMKLLIIANKASFCS
jgi:hypothetical protein